MVTNRGKMQAASYVLEGSDNIRDELMAHLNLQLPVMFSSILNQLRFLYLMEESSSYGGFYPSIVC